MTDRAESLAGVPADPLVHLVDLVVREAGVRLGDRDELALVPDAERVVGQQTGAPAAPRLRVDEDGVDRVRIDLPLPPVAALAADAVRRRSALEHEALHCPRARVGAKRGKRLPAGPL